MNIIKTELVTTRKEHQCLGCLIKYPAKSEMERQTVNDDGEIYSTYLCEHCQEILNEAHEDFPDGFEEGDLRQWESENETKNLPD